MTVGARDVATEQIAEIERTYESGRYRTAYVAARDVGLLAPMQSAPPEHAVLAGRILRTNGARKRGRKIILETWRRHRRDPAARAHTAFELGSDSPVQALDWMDAQGDLAGASPEHASDWLTARASCLIELRDFRGAERAIDAAQALHTDAWTWALRAMLENARDRFDAALAAVTEARKLSQWYRPLVECAAQVLVRCRRLDEARTLLGEATTHIEAASTHMILSTLHREAGDLDAALASLHHAVAFAPAMERELHDGLAAMLAYTHYLRGDDAESKRLFELCSDQAVRERAQKIAATPGIRKSIRVPHVPQHHRTCGPATLTAIAELWGERVEHADVVEKICHDGTPAGNERKWAEERVFVVRQLTVTWDAARALIDAGIPIALTTSFTLGAHLQPVAGYDERRGSLLVVEPGATGLVELDWERLAALQAPFGPRGMVFLPRDRASLLDGIALPDAALYDHHHQIEIALRRHERSAAQAAYDALVSAAPPGHYLTHNARRALSSYDGDERGTLAWIAALREQHPDDAFLQMCELGSLQGHASDERRQELAHRLVAKHGDDAAVLVAVGRFLLDRGEVVRAYGCAIRAARAAPQHPAAYSLLADLAWLAGDRGRATQRYRIASCLADGDETAAWSYFAVSVITGGIDEALDHLRDRVSRMATRSALPAQTLCDAYRAVGRAAEGSAVLDATIAAHPDDGTLLVVAAEQARVSGDLTRAGELLGRARGKLSDRAWRRVAASLAEHRGETEQAQALRREAVTDDPLDIVSQTAYVALLRRSGSLEDARTHVLDACARFPFHIPLAQLCHGVLTAIDPSATRAHLEAFLERQPRSSWALYQLADVHAQQGDLATARSLLQRAHACNDDVAAGKVAEAALDMREGRRESAMTLLRSAIALDVDEPGAVYRLLSLARDGNQAREMLTAVASELARQGSSGNGLAGYAAGLREYVDPPTALARLREIRVARPYQWHAWNAEITALVDAGRLDEALAVATSATERYGHEPRAWRQLADVEAARADRAAHIRALERTLELEPRGTEPLRRLVDAYLADKNLAAARAASERALAIEPLDERNHASLATIPNVEGDDASAQRLMLRAVELQPEYAWAWNRLLDWAIDDQALFDAARAVIDREPRAIAPRLLLAEHAPDLNVDERVALFDAAIAIAPDRVDLNDAQAVLLANHERWDEALAACKPAFWGKSPPSTLLGRAAWIRYMRGEHAEAMDDMLAAIMRTPSYDWAIHQVLAWGKAARAPVRTAQRVVEAAPTSALAHAALGELLREADRLDEAEPCFARALEIDGSYELARIGLFDALFSQEKYAAAAPVLEGLDPDRPDVAARHIQTLAATGRLDEADASLARLLRSDELDREIVDEATYGYRKARAHDRLDALLDRLLAEPDASHAAATAWWFQVGRHRGVFQRWRQIKRLPPSKAASLAASYHVEAYGTHGDLLGILIFLMLNYRIARTRTDVWGSVGYSLLAARRYVLARWWLADHEQRSGLKPWMLTTLVRALIGTGRVTRGLEVCGTALKLPEDGSTAQLRLLAAPFVALDDQDAATRSISAARARPWTGEMRFLGGLAEALIAYCRGPRDNAGLETLATACDELWSRYRRDATRPCHQAYEYAIKRISRTLGARGWLWVASMRRLKS